MPGLDEALEVDDGDGGEGDDGAEAHLVALEDEEGVPEEVPPEEGGQGVPDAGAHPLQKHPLAHQLVPVVNPGNRKR